MSSDALFLPFFSFVCPPKPHPPAFPLLLTSVLLVYSLHLQFNPFLGRGHSSPPPSLTGPLCVALYFIKLTSPPPALFVSASILLGSKQSPSWYVFLLLFFFNLFSNLVDPFLRASFRFILPSLKQPQQPQPYPNNPQQPQPYRLHLGVQPQAMWLILLPVSLCSSPFGITVIIYSTNIY